MSNCAAVRCWGQTNGGSSDGADGSCDGPNMGRRFWERPRDRRQKLTCRQRVLGRMYKTGRATAERVCSSGGEQCLTGSMLAWTVTAWETTRGCGRRRVPVCGDGVGGRTARQRAQDGFLRAPPCTSSPARFRNARHRLIDRPGRWCGADGQIRPAKRTSFILDAAVFDAGARSTAPGPPPRVRVHSLARPPVHVAVPVSGATRASWSCPWSLCLLSRRYAQPPRSNSGAQLRAQAARRQGLSARTAPTMLIPIFNDDKPSPLGCRRPLPA
jgi:hypothetical protein